MWDNKWPCCRSKWFVPLIRCSNKHFCIGLIMVCQNNKWWEMTCNGNSSICFQQLRSVSLTKHQTTEEILFRQLRDFSQCNTIILLLACEMLSARISLVTSFVHRKLIDVLACCVKVIESRKDAPPPVMEMASNSTFPKLFFAKEKRVLPFCTGGQKRRSVSLDVWYSLLLFHFHQCSGSRLRRTRIKSSFWFF